VSEAFDSETCELMARALIHALKQLETSGLLDGKGRDEAEAVLTRGIVGAATLGERDEFKLAASALTHFQQAGK
jgi:hypothetical protein